MDLRRVPADALTDFVTRAFEAAGVDGPAARDVARTMVEADLLGYDTHGVFRLGQYVDRLRNGGSNAMASPQVVRETAATALIDGDDGLGSNGVHRLDVINELVLAPGMHIPHHRPEHHDGGDGVHGAARRDRDSVRVGLAEPVDL